MTEIKALDKLRYPEHEMTGCECNRIADLIQAEVDRRYMLLPVDADGVPIHVGDVMTLRHGKTCEVVAVSETQFTGKKLGSENCVCNANLHRHVKPRTLEDVLNAFVDELNSPAEDDGRDLVAEYEAKIRELFGGENQCQI